MVVRSAPKFAVWLWVGSWNIHRNFLQNWRWLWRVFYESCKFLIAYLLINFEFQIFETGLFFWTILVAMVRPSIWFVFWLAVYLLTTCFHMVWTILDNICFDIFDDWRYSKFSLQGAVEVLKQFSVFALGQIAPDSLKLLWELLFEVLGSSWLLEVPKIKNIAIMIRQQEAFMLSPSVGILLMFSVCFWTFLFKIEPFF